MDEAASGMDSLLEQADIGMQSGARPRQFALLSPSPVRHNRRMPEPARQNIVLVGFMGSGKSSIGRLVASRLRFQFIDTDRMIVDRAQAEIPELFAQHGEAGFRDLEASAIESLAPLNRSVIATGGGAILRERNRALLRDLGLVVALTATEETIFERISRNTRRPLLQTENPRETISRMMDARRPFYEEAAQFSVDTTNLSHAEAAEAIVGEARRVFLWQVPE